MEGTHPGSLGAAIQESTLIRLASLGTFPLVGGRLRATARVAPTAEKGPGTLVRQLRRSPKIAAKSNFAHPGPQWGRIQTQASTPDFTRRKFCNTNQEGVPRNGVRGKQPMGLGGA